jgi:hypothetical protein
MRIYRTTGGAGGFGLLEVLCAAACSAAFCGTAMADSSQDDARDPANPAFIPIAHEFYGATAFGYVKSTGDVTGGVAPGKTTTGNYSFDTRSQLFSQSFSYGFTERLSLAVGVGHAKFDTDYDSAIGSTKSRDSGGIARIAVTDRVLSQAVNGLNLDLSLGAGGGAGAGAAVSYQGSAVTVLGRAGMYYLKGLTIFDSIENKDISYHEAWGYQVGLQTQLRLSPRFSVGLGAAYISAPFGTSAATGSGSSFQLRRPDVISLGASAVWRLTPERLSLRFGYGHDFIGRRVDEYPNPAMNVIVGSQEQDGVSVSLAYRL